MIIKLPKYSSIIVAIALQQESVKTKSLLMKQFRKVVQGVRVLLSIPIIIDMKRMERNVELPSSWFETTAVVESHFNLEPSDNSKAGTGSAESKERRYFL